MAVDAPLTDGVAVGIVGADGALNTHGRGWRFHQPRLERDNPYRRGRRRSGGRQCDWYCLYSHTGVVDDGVEVGRDVLNDCSGPQVSACPGPSTRLSKMQQSFLGEYGLGCAYLSGAIEIIDRTTITVSVQPTSNLALWLADIRELGHVGRYARYLPDSQRQLYAPACDDFEQMALNKQRLRWRLCALLKQRQLPRRHGLREWSLHGRNLCRNPRLRGG